MSKRTEQITENKTFTVVKNVTKVNCDVCGTPIVDYPAYSCCMCGKDLCKDCVEHVDNDFVEFIFGPSEDSRHYCKECWEKGTTCRELIVMLSSDISEIKQKQENLYKEWESKCKNQQI